MEIVFISVAVFAAALALILDSFLFMDEKLFVFCNFSKCTRRTRTQTHRHTHIQNVWLESIIVFDYYFSIWRGIIAMKCNRKGNDVGHVSLRCELRECSFINLN